MLAGPRGVVSSVIVDSGGRFGTSSLLTAWDFAGPSWHGAAFVVGPGPRETAHLQSGHSSQSGTLRSSKIQNVDVLCTTIFLYEGLQACGSIIGFARAR